MVLIICQLSCKFFCHYDCQQRRRFHHFCCCVKKHKKCDRVKNDANIMIWHNVGWMDINFSDTGFVDFLFIQVMRKKFLRTTLETEIIQGSVSGINGSAFLSSEVCARVYSYV